MLNRAVEHLEDILKKEFAPFPKWGDPAWKNLTPEAREFLIHQGEESADGDWPVLRLTLYMDDKRNGNRINYENVYFGRRERLWRLLLAECVEGKGRFIDPIIDGLWAVCEESYWVIPAHNNYHHDDALPDYLRKPPYIDLFSAETGSLMTWIYYMLSDRLAQESRLIPLRIEQELKSRILDPFLAYDDMWWMGLINDHPVNNWNPWIVSNVIVTILIMEKDENRRIEALKKAARCAQRFIDGYAEDGGCDEGPVYFNVAGASLMDILELFYDATDGKVSLYDQPLIRNMADYIRYMHIDGPNYVNYADASSDNRCVPAGLMLRIGKITENPELEDFARRGYQGGFMLKPWKMKMRSYWQLYRTLRSLLDYSDDDCVPRSNGTISSHYFPSIEVAVGRTMNDLFFSAKGGHNAESHNHNDIGNYLVFAHGQPGALDAGVGTYSKKTFSERRYEIWSMQSGYHNTAIINGCDQLPGSEYAAHSTVFSSDDSTVCFSLNMEKAYPTKASLNSYRRSFELDKTADTLTVTDQVSLKECCEPVQLPILCLKPPVIEEGHVFLNGTILSFDPSQFTASYEEVPLLDEENPITSWNQEYLYRLLLSRKDCLTDDSWKITYSLA